MPLITDRELVRSLHDAYVDKTETYYSGLSRVPGDPFQVRLRSFGTTPTCIAKGHDWSNRATLVGDETAERVDEIAAYCSEQGQRCHIE